MSTYIEIQRPQQRAFFVVNGNVAGCVKERKNEMRLPHRNNPST